MPDYPSGTVTFLFTDIEGSTRLWQQHPVAMPAALARHDTILRSLVAAHAGYVFKTVGDAFCAAFDTTPQALSAAVAIQRALLTEAKDELPLRVRIALHTGAAELRDGDYFGASLSRVARLMAAGHGGQVLLSQATATLLGDDLPTAVTLHDLGDRRLRDLVRPERIFQVVAPDLPAEFPPLKTLEAFPNNLPMQLTRFIGREQQMSEVKRLLGKTRLLTLTGVGGTGKTRLTLEVGAELLEGFPDGVWLVELAPLADPGLVPHAVASVLGVREEPGRPLLATLTDYLRAKHLLLLLDNCEHLIEACARLVEALLRACPQLHVLATSREALGAPGETSWPVPSLTQPDPRQAVPLATLTQYEAVRLFIDRATAVKPDFNVTNANAPAVAQVCHRLDGIPLAIELAAARVRAMTVEQINQRLDDRFRLLTGGSRTALPRQQTLQASIDWSYSLLSERERALLRRLAVFAGGWTLEAAERVCGDERGDGRRQTAAGESALRTVGDGLLTTDVLDTLTQLVDKSLVVAEDQEQETRYRLLETIRQYGREKLLAAGEGDWVRDRHLDYYLMLGEEGGQQLLGSEQFAWLNRLGGELENFRAAIQWALDSPPGSARPELGARLSWALFWYWAHTGSQQEGSQYLERFLALPIGQAATATRALALLGAHWLSFRGSDTTYIEESVALFRRMGDLGSLAWALVKLGNAESAHYLNLPRTETLLAESADLFQAIGERWGLAFVRLQQALSAMRQGDYARARALQQESAAHYKALGDRIYYSVAVSHIGVVDLREGDYAAAVAHFDERLTVARKGGGAFNIRAALLFKGTATLFQGEYDAALAFFQESHVLVQQMVLSGNSLEIVSIGETYRLMGNPSEAVRLFRESLGRPVRIGLDRWSVILALRGLAGLSLAVGKGERAARLLGAAQRADAVGVSSRAFLPAGVTYEQDRATAHAHLGDAAFEAAWAAGQAMTLEEAVAYALEDHDGG